MLCFDNRLILTEALARFLRGEEGDGRDLVGRLRAEDDTYAWDLGRRLSAAANAPPELVRLAAELGLDVRDFCRARLLEAYQDLDWSRIVPWEEAVVATGDGDAIAWMILVDVNAGRYQRALDKFGHLTQTAVAPDIDALRAVCLAHVSPRTDE